MPDSTTSRSISSTASPARAAADLEADLAEALALEPEHVSCYELEAKPGTRFTHAHGAELERQAESMESYFERVVETLTATRLPLVRDGELLPRCEDGAGPAGAAQPRATGSDGTTSGSGSAPSRQSTACGGGTRRGSAATSRRSRTGAGPPRELEPLDGGTSASASGCCSAFGSTSRCRSPGWKQRSTATRSRGSSGSAWSVRAGVNGSETLALTERGRFLGGGVTAELLA